LPEGEPFRRAKRADRGERNREGCERGLRHSRVTCAETHTH
jgi:hypothetical protein